MLIDENETNDSVFVDFRSGSGRAVTLNSLQMKTGATISTVDIRPSLPK